MYDSKPSCSIGSHDLNKQLAAIMQCSAKCMYVRHVNVQRQSGLSDCGNFAIAFATALYIGIDPYTLNIDQNKSRIHLLKCFEQMYSKKNNIPCNPPKGLGGLQGNVLQQQKQLNSFVCVTCPTKKMILPPQWHSALNA